MIIALLSLSLLGIFCFITSRNLGIKSVFFLVPFFTASIIGFWGNPFIFLLFILIGAAGRLFQSRRVYALRSAYSVLVVFCFYMVIRMLVGLSVESGIKTSDIVIISIFMLIPVVALILASQLRNFDVRGDCLIPITLGSGLYYLLIAIFYAKNLFGTVLETQGFPRLVGIGGTHPAYTTALVPVVISGSLFLMVDNLAKRRVHALLSLIAATIVMVLSASRASLVSGTLAWVLIMLVLKPWFIRRTFRLVTIVTLVAGLGFFVVGPEQVRHFRSVFEGDPEHRVIIYPAAVEVARANLLFGLGNIDYFRAYAPPIIEKYADHMKPGYSRLIWLYLDRNSLNVSSTILWLLVNGGLLAVILFVCLILATTRRLLRAIRAAPEKDRLAWASLMVGWVIFLLHLSIIEGIAHPFLWIMIILSLSRRFGGAERARRALEEA
ncbi:MAG: O-antigen ligase family protein [Chloroflexi bacterium]|nr:O-antigen ligase family protein [Chloroflexota bacterium]